VVHAVLKGRLRSHDDEQEAAYAAYYMIDGGMAFPTGVQFADGRTIKFEDWAFYREIEKRILLEESRQDISAQQRPKRTVLDPFSGAEVAIDADSPGWVGDRKVRA
jgi:hypothetical protein